MPLPPYGSLYITTSAFRLGTYTKIRQLDKYSISQNQKDIAALERKGGRKDNETFK